MSTVNTTAPPIAVGYDYAVNIQTAGTREVFPADGLLRAQVRSRETSDAVIVELTSDNGGIQRISGTEIAIRIDADVTATITGKTVVFDVVSGDDYLYLRMRVDVIKPITRNV